MRDFKRLQTDPPQGVNGTPCPDNIMLWNAVIFGPEDTPWDGGTSFSREERTSSGGGAVGGGGGGGRGRGRSFRSPPPPKHPPKKQTKQARSG